MVPLGSMHIDRYGHMESAGFRPGSIEIAPIQSFYVSDKSMEPQETGDLPEVTELLHGVAAQSAPECDAAVSRRPFGLPGNWGLVVLLTGFSRGLGALWRMH